MKATATDYERGFQKGYGHLQQKDVTLAKKYLWSALQINNRYSFRQYLVGRSQCSVAQAARVEEVFNSFGITEIWGE